jgi:hypothetical protein
VAKITREKVDQNSLQHQKKKGVLINSAILPFRSMTTLENSNLIFSNKKKNGSQTNILSGVLDLSKFSSAR